MGIQGAAAVETGGPVAPTGNKSRFNAVKHGLTAKTPVLPGEDPAELQAKIDAYTTSHQVRNQAEADLAKLAAMACWRAERANRLEVSRVTGDIVRRSRAHVAQETLVAEGLGERLLFDRRGPSQLYPSRDYEHKEPRTSDSGVPDDPDKPRRLVIQLEATRAGRHWLLDRLDEVRKPIDSGQGWVSSQKLKAVRLLGKQPLDALFDREAALVFLASHAIKPVFKSAFRELRCEIHYDRVKFYEGQLSRPEIRALTPPDAGAGRAVLLEIIDQAIERLWRLEAEAAEGDEILEMVEPNIVSDEEAKPVGQIQRHLESSNRLVIRNLEAIKRWHRWDEDGWYKVRRDRERRKELARRGIMDDERFVLDERGTVYDAQGYNGDLEAGLARWKATNGRQPCEDPNWRARGAGGGNYTGGKVSDVSAKAGDWQSQGQTEAVTDRTCETASGSGDAQGAPGSDRADVVAADGAVHQDAVDGAEMRDGAADLGQAGLSNSVPLTLTGQEPATNIQNEIDGAGMNEAGIQEGAGDPVVGREDLGGREAGGTDLVDGVEPSGAREPSRTVEATDFGQAGLTNFVPLTVTGQEPATNIQNEIDGSGSGEPSGAGDPRRLAEHESGEPSGGCDPRGTVAFVRGESSEGGGGREVSETSPGNGSKTATSVSVQVSKCERQRRRREVAKKEIGRRGGANKRGRNVLSDAELDSIEWLMPNSVAFLRKHMLRSP